MMFDQTSSLGKPTSGAFGPQSVFGQTNNANSNPFVGGTTPFGFPTGGSVFKGTSTGVYGGGFTQTPSLFSSRAAFGDFSSSAFGGSSPFGQNPAFGLFGSTPAQTSTSGTTSHPPPPAFGSRIFGSSTPFGAQSQSEVSASSTPGFGSSSSAFGTRSTPAFVTESAPSFGATRTPAFSSTMMAAFDTGGMAFGTTKAGSGDVFGASRNPALKASCSSSFSFGSSPAFGPSKTTLRSNQFGSKSDGAHTGSQIATPTFGRIERGKSFFGSRAAPFSPTTEANTGALAPDKLQSICGMSVPVYKFKSHDELRWEDYQCGDKGGPNHAGQSGVSVGPGASPAIPRPSFSQLSPLSSTAAFNAFSSSPASATTSNPFSLTTSFNELSMTDNNSFVSNPSSNAGSWPSPNTSPLGCSSSLTSVVRSPCFAFEVSAPPSIFSSPVSATVGASPLVISAPTTQSSLLFLSTTPSIAKTASDSTQKPTSFSQTTFGQIYTVGTASSGSGGSLFPSTPLPVLSTNAATISQTNPSRSLPFQTSEAGETSGVCSLGNLRQKQAAGTGGLGSQNAFGQNHIGQSSISGSSSVVQPAFVTNPFGTVPAVQKFSIGCTETGSPVQYGISTMPVADKPSPVRKSPLLSARHLSLRQTRLPARKYHPEKGVQRVPFFYDGDNPPSKPEANALFIPRRNPRSLVIGPENWPAREQKPSRVKKTYPCANGFCYAAVGVPKDGLLDEQTDFVNASQKIKGVHYDSSLQNDKEYVTTKGDGESATEFECGAVIEALMPKLCQPDYYTEPHIRELAAKERAEPGFCCRVKDFVIGRLGYGHIKFVGEIDVRRLDIESLIRFNNREVIVYPDESKKPPVGQGLNKPAEVTLLNIKCIDKKTGKQYMEGPKVEKYKEMLKKKAEEQGAQFVSYDPIKGEWKFKVYHFS